MPETMLQRLVNGVWSKGRHDLLSTVTFDVLQAGHHIAR